MHVFALNNKNGKSRKQRILVVTTLALTIAVIILFIFWKQATDSGGQQPAEPFRIAGNFYYVGASDAASFLITSPEGHILIDGGYPGTAPMIMESITKLGFNIGDVKIILNSEPHFDHAGGIAEIQKASGAEVWASEISAQALRSGGDEGDNDTFLPHRILVMIGVISYSAPRVDHQFNDGATISLGNNKLTAHITAGHTRGCTTWSFPVREGERELNVVSACSLKLLPGMSLVEPENYPGIRGDFEDTFQTLRNLPADIWVTSHAREFGRYRKFAERQKTQTNPFIDRSGYLDYINKGEEKFRQTLAEQQQSQQGK